MQITSNSPQGNAIVDMVPTVIDKITSFIDGKKGGKKAADEIADDYADFEE